MFKKEKRVEINTFKQVKHVYFILERKIGRDKFGKGQAKDFTYFQIYLLICNCPMRGHYALKQN